MTSAQVIDVATVMLTLMAESLLSKSPLQYWRLYGSCSGWIYWSSNIDCFRGASAISVAAMTLTLLRTVLTLSVLLQWHCRRFDRCLCCQSRSDNWGVASAVTITFMTVTRSWHLLIVSVVQLILLHFQQRQWWHFFDRPNNGTDLFVAFS